MDEYNNYNNGNKTESEINNNQNRENAEKNSGTYSYTPNNNFNSYGSVKTDNNSTEPCKKEKRTVGIGVVIVCIVLSVLVSTATSLGLAFNVLGGDNTDSSALNGTVSNDSSLSDGVENNTSSTVINISGNIESLVEAVYTKSAASVVGIRTTASVQGIFGGSGESTGVGSGVIYTDDGYIITNYHVVSDVVSNPSKTSLEVFLMSDPDTPIDATVVGYNISADLAVIKIERSGLSPIEFSNSDDIKVGQYAIVIGCPGGLEFFNSASYGIISGLNRTITVDSVGEMELIQTDAAINPGNSGGALLNSSGQLIGISSSKLVNTKIDNMGFAIPVNTVAKVVQEIMENKDNPSPYIGIEIYTYSSAYLEKYSLPRGAAVKSVVNGAPADKAQIRAGDIITEFNKISINEYKDFIDVLDKCMPGTKVTAKIYRNGRYYTTTVTIGSNNSY